MDPCWTDFGGQDGAKLGPCWAYVGAWAPQKEHSKNISKNIHKNDAEEDGVPGGGGPLEQRKKEEKGYQGEKKMQKTPHGAQGAVVDIYIYIYMFTGRAGLGPARRA